MTPSIAEEKIDTVPLPEQKIGTWPTPEVRELRIPGELLRKLEGPAGLVIRQGWMVGLPISMDHYNHLLSHPDLKHLLEDKFNVLLVPK